MSAGKKQPLIPNRISVSPPPHPFTLFPLLPFRFPQAGDLEKPVARARRNQKHERTPIFLSRFRFLRALTTRPFPNRSSGSLWDLWDLYGAAAGGRWTAVNNEARRCEDEVDLR